MFIVNEFKIVDKLIIVVRKIIFLGNFLVGFLVVFM